jgi:RimJ/RimL family protein N-acetyltransferase
VDFNPLPLTLAGKSVVLEPLAVEHAEELFAIAQDPDIWRYMTCAPLTSLASTRLFIEQALVSAATGAEMPFVIRCQATGRAIGSTRYLDIRRPHRALEIGATWLGTAFQRTAANTETKLLLLSHAFDDLGAIRVQLKTDERNVRSQRAIERIGAFREGLHRKQMILWDGYIRNAVFYSITDEEWPLARQRLQARLR